MFITLTSANPDIKDHPIVLNSEFFVSIYRGEKKSKADIIDVTEEVTFVFCPPHGTWEVNETPEEILAIINK
jgi:hypothetical protein